MLRSLTVLLVSCLIALPVAGAMLISKDSTYRYFKGTSEASSPDATAWRALDFKDASWLSGQVAFYYENQPTSANAYTGNTVLSDMFGGYTCMFLRRKFVVTNLNDIATLQIAGYSDDGFIAWINGQEVARFNMPAGNIAYTGVASGSLTEPIPWWTNTVSSVQSLLVSGTNVLAAQAFNVNKGSSSDFIINPALYYTPDTTAPKVTLLFPEAGSTNRQLTSVEVGFDEAVSGVEAGDLLINNQPAANVTAVTPAQFVFTFPQPAAGTVQFTWAPGHGIRDLSYASNLFAGGNWSCAVDPNAPVQGVVISEFMAANSGDQTNSVHDELGNSPDWIELYNNSSKAISLTGWFLTDDAAKPTKWQFPATLLPANSYLLVLASGRDTNVLGRLHTNFKLSAGGSYLALLDSATNVISAFAPGYPQQFTDVSYGRDRLDPSLVGYYTNSTPGAANATQGAGFGSEVQFSRVGGAFITDFILTLNTSNTNCDIRYLVITTNVPSGSVAVTNVPTATSPLYLAPLVVNATAQVRARAFPRQPGFWPGPSRTESYVKLSPSLAGFTSDLPLIILHNLTGGTVPQTTDQNVIAMVFEPVNGVTSLTNPPTLVTRAGFNIRGSSTAGLAQSSYALEIWDEFNRDRDAEFLGLPTESDWVLFAQNGFDPSYLHNPLIHQLSRDSGRYSSRTRFAEVFLNTAGGWLSYSPHYNGLYTIEEKIKRSKDRVDIAALELQNTNAPTVTGGYLLKIDRADSNERTFYDSYLQGNIVFQEPPGLEMVTTARRAQYNYITNYFGQFGAALWGTNYTNPVIGYAAYIDADSWIDHHLLNALTFNADAFRFSGFFFKDRDQKLEMGPLWDFDRSMGSTDARPFNPRIWRVQATGDQGTDYFGVLYPTPVLWWQRLFNDPDFWQKWIDRWTDLRRDVLTTNHIFALVDTLGNKVKKAAPREVARWSGTSSATTPRSGYVTANGYAYTFPGTYQGELDFLKKWLADRVDFFDTNFLRAPVFSAGGGPVTNGFPLTMTAPTIESNTVTYFTLDGSDPRLPGGAISPTAFFSNGPIRLTITNNIRLFARNRNPNHFNVTNWPGSVGGNPPISSPWSGTTIGTFVVATPPLAITEIMFHPAPPASGTNAAGDFEFIEFKNVGSQPLNLVGIHFTNGIEFTFTATNAITTLGAGQYCVLVRNRAAFQSRYPTVTNIAGTYSNSLDNAGERLVLHGALQEPILDFSFKDGWYPVTDGLGFSLVIRNEGAPFSAWNSATNWRASTAIGGSPGRADPAPNDVPAVVINEALTHTDSPEVDAVELFNPTGSPANIGGWFLTDNRSQPLNYRIPTNTILPAGGFVLITETQFNSGGSGSFALSSLGEEVYLFSGDGTNITGYRHGFDFGAQVNSVTFGRHVSSDGLEHFVTQERTTLGAANAGPKVGPVVLNEIMFAPPPFGSNANTLEEFVELRNFSSQPAPLFDPLHATNAWKLDGAVQFTFPPGVTMAPRSYLLLVNFDPEHDPVMLNWFRGRYGIDVNTPLFGPFAGKLASEGERIGLYLPDKPEVAPSPIAGFVPCVLVEEVHYSNQWPWPADADGTGKSLQRIAAITFGDDPANWQSAPPTAGRVNQGLLVADTDHDALPDDWELENSLDPKDPSGINGPLGDPDGDGANNLQEFLGGTNPNDSQDFLRLGCATVSDQFCQLQFNTRTGYTYAVEALDDAALTNTWTLVSGGIAGTGRPVTVSDPLTTAGRFYRLKVTRN